MGRAARNANCGCHGRASLRNVPATPGHRLRWPGGRSGSRLAAGNSRRPKKRKAPAQPGLAVVAPRPAAGAGASSRRGGAGARRRAARLIAPRRVVAGEGASSRRGPRAAAAPRARRAPRGYPAAWSLRPSCNAQRGVQLQFLRNACTGFTPCQVTRRRGCPGCSERHVERHAAPRAVCGLQPAACRLPTKDEPAAQKREQHVAWSCVKPEETT